MNIPWLHFMTFVCLLLLITTLIIIILDHKQLSVVVDSTVQHHHDVSNRERSNFLVSIMEALTDRAPNISYDIDAENLIVTARTPKQSIYMIPCYHNCEDRTASFLAQPKPSNAVYLVVDGEPNPIPNNPKIDMVITTKRGLDDSHFYVPYYAMYANQCFKPIGSLLEPSCPHRTSVEGWQARHFMAFAYSNDNTTRYKGCADRALFYQVALKRCGSRIHNLGLQCKTNKLYSTDSVSKGEQSYELNDNRFQKYKFVIAFENSQLRGYISEKMLNPILAGAIPVYLGADDIEEHFNPASFINVSKYPSFEHCVEDLLALENDSGRVSQMLHSTPIINDKFFDFIRVKGGELWPRLLNSPLKPFINVKRLFPNRIVFMTFDYSNNESGEHLRQIATASGCFDDVMCLHDFNLPYDFITVHKSFMLKHPQKGFGIWKSTLIYSQLQTMCENDILVYMECTTHQMPNNDWFYLYQDLLHSQVNVLARNTSILEKQVASSKILSLMNVNGDTQHVSSNCILFKSNPECLTFVDKWKSISTQHELLDSCGGDAPVFSCLMKTEQQCILPEIK